LRGVVAVAVPHSIAMMRVHNSVSKEEAASLESPTA
jgi:hypothetical protein